MILFVLPYPWDGTPHQRPHASTFLYQAVAERVPAMACNVLSWRYLRRYPTSLPRFWSRRAPTSILVRDPSDGEQIGAALRRRGLRPEWVVWSDPAHVDAIPCLPDSRHAYYCTDDFVAARGRSTAEQEARMTASCERVTAVSHRLARRLGTAHVLPNGVDPEEALAEPAPHPLLQGMEEPRIAYVGHLNPRVDVAILTAVARTMHGSLVLVGPRTSNDAAWDRLLAMPRVHATGWRDRGEVRQILGGATVGLVPYTMSDFNLSCSPLKIHEYVGAGLRVVSTALPAVEAAPPLVWLEGREEAFAARVQALAALPRLSREIRTAHVRQHAWSTRAATFLNSLPVPAHVG